MSVVVYFGSFVLPTKHHKQQQNICCLNSIKISTNNSLKLVSLRNTKATDFVSSNNKFRHNSSSFKCHCKKHSQGFSILDSDIPWDSGSVWSTYAFYLFSFHVPLSFGGLSAVSYLLDQPLLDPQTEALLLVAIQMLELITVFWVLSQVVWPQYEPRSLFQVKSQAKTRNWALTSALGFSFLVLLVFFSSSLADQMPGNTPVEATNQTVNKILSSGVISQASCILAYCIFTPLLEEIIYRGIILKSLTSQIKWYQAVAISSAVFSAAHFSGENFLQLFVIGSVLGCSYCWTGTLSSPFVIHSLYNALILVSTNLS